MKSFFLFVFFINNFFKNKKNFQFEENQILGIGAFESTERLSEIKKPTLIIHGSSDKLVPPSHGMDLHQGIKNSQIKLIPEAGHMYYFLLFQI